MIVLAPHFRPLGAGTPSAFNPWAIWRALRPFRNSAKIRRTTVASASTIVRRPRSGWPRASNPGTSA
ncbi:MAG: hypothetical protein K2Y20_05495 [Sphingomonas sp.]|nr:hypothetical protein [Sphingomonas sp.]